MGNSPVDRDAKYMKEQWGTTRLATDYFIEENMTTQNDFLDNLANHQHQKMLREIANDDKTPKKRDYQIQTELYEIDNDDNNDNILKG
tara:strand:- start:146 stop:409 length:264 start_codon:yes stop_codon:yes gene_type:complete